VEPALVITLGRASQSLFTEHIPVDIVPDARVDHHLDTLVEWLNQTIERIAIQISSIVKEHEPVTRLDEPGNGCPVINEIYVYMFSVHHAHPVQVQE
jgi:hypothetical protein